MLLQNNLLAKTFGWLLPFCFVASFVACVNNCSHDEAATDEGESYQSVALAGLNECEDCTVTALPVALAQRQSNLHSITASGVEQSFEKFSATVSSTSNELITQPYRFISTSDPPLERFCVIRI